jgi:hypothetical protein
VWGLKYRIGLGRSTNLLQPCYFFRFSAFIFAVVPQTTDFSLWTTTWLTLLKTSEKLIECKEQLTNLGARYLSPYEQNSTSTSTEKTPAAARSAEKNAVSGKL